MSGSPFGDPMSVAPLARAEAEGLALQNALGAKSIEDLRDIGGDRIIAAQRAAFLDRDRRALRHRRRRRKRLPQGARTTCR